ncbi:hypothetical protein KUV57_12775 [Epibacterium sp. DP7N7-1]|nr:hypothetical protein [Epibacterium sp. DP7N7-1]
MKTKSEQAIRKRAIEDLQRASKALKSVGDHGTVAQLRPIVDRLEERRALVTARHSQDKA